MPPPPTTTKGNIWSTLDGGVNFSNPNKIIENNDLTDCIGYCFAREYNNYLNLLHDYNSQATEINFKAAQLGEPPVVLLEQYNPELR